MLIQGLNACTFNGALTRYRTQSSASSRSRLSLKAASPLTSHNGDLTYKYQTSGNHSVLIADLHTSDIDYQVADPLRDSTLRFFSYQSTSHAGRQGSLHAVVTQLMLSPLSNTWQSQPSWHGLVFIMRIATARQDQPLIVGCYRYFPSWLGSAPRGSEDKI